MKTELTERERDKLLKYTHAVSPDAVGVVLEEKEKLVAAGLKPVRVIFRGPFVPGTYEFRHTMRSYGIEWDKTCGIVLHDTQLESRPQGIGRRWQAVVIGTHLPTELRGKWRCIRSSKLMDGKLKMDLRA